MQTSCPAHFDPFRPFPHVGHGVGQPTDPHFDPHQKIKIRNKKALKTEVFKAFWSCYPDLNWGPHPYQLTKGCCCLLLFILPYCSQSVVPQCFRKLPPALCRSLSRLKIYCFLMPVSVLCRFLLEPAPADLIPTSAVLRPLRAAFLRPVRPIHELQRPDRGAGV